MGWVERNVFGNVRVDFRGEFFSIYEFIFSKN